jgi:hypothetical protein
MGHFNIRCWQDVLAADPSWQAQGARGRRQCAGATAVLCHRIDHQRRHSLYRRQLGAGCCLRWVFRSAAGVFCLSVSERQLTGAWLQALVISCCRYSTLKRTPVMVFG